MSAQFADVAVSYRVLLSSDTAREYEQQAGEADLAIETLLEKRLKACAEHSATKPLYFDDDQRRELEAALQCNVANSKQALKYIKNALSCRVNGVNVALNPAVLDRLKSRHADNTPFFEYLNTVVTQMLEEYVGLR